MNAPVEPLDCLPQVGQPAGRRSTRQMVVQWGDRRVHIGSAAPIVVQSMTNTDSADAIATAIQVKQLAQAGSEIVRITVNSPEAAAEVAPIREQLAVMTSNETTRTSASNRVVRRWVGRDVSGVCTLSVLTNFPSS